MDPQKFDYNQDYNYNFGSNYGPGFNPNNNFYNKRSRNMEVAALVLSIIAIASCSCIYVSIICGSLAMIFALLSKGGATSMSSMAMTSFWIAFAAVVITLIIYIGSFAAMLHEYGSIEGILKEYQNLTGIDYNELLQQRDELKEALISLMWQFAYYGTKNNVAVMHTGGLSALEDAFSALGLSDPITVENFEAAIKNTESQKTEGGGE